MNSLVVITSRVHENFVNTFRKNGYDVHYNPSITYDELKTVIPLAVGVVVTTRIRIDAEMINIAPKLKWIGRLGSGMELIDVNHATSKGIQCFSSPEGNRLAVAEHALGMLLSLRHRINSSASQVRHGEWRREENRGSELSGKTVGIVGFGNTGAAFAHLLAPFEVTVLAYDKYKYGFSEGYIKEASLEQLCRYSDVISFHVPLTDETFHMGNGELFKTMSRKPYVINTARGSVVNITELIDCLKQQQIAGAALDVLENEQLSALTEKQRIELAWLTEQPNVIVTPHIAGYSIEAFERMGTVLLQKLGVT